MEIFTDKNSGWKFCIKRGTEYADKIIQYGIPDYQLIKWCEQFVTPEGSFIDINSNLGTFAIFLSKKCKQVYILEPRQEFLDCIGVGLAINNVYNVKCHKECKSLDNYDIKNLEFLRIETDGSELEIVKEISLLLMNNNFPPFIFTNITDELSAFIKNLGYKIVPISGCNGKYLACDHPLNVKKEVKKEDEPAKYDVELLVEKYKNDTLQEEFNDEQPEWEIYLELAKHFRFVSKHKESYDCIQKGLSSAHPFEKDYLFHQENSIIAFYMNKKEEGFKSCEQVVLSKVAQWHERNLTLSNECFYIHPIAHKKKVPLKCEMADLYEPSSSSIMKWEDGYRMILRGVNYSIGSKGEYYMRHNDNIVRTKNYLLTLNKDFEVLKQVELVDKSGVKIWEKNIVGMEDLRIFGDKYFLCTYPQVTASDHYRVCWGTYDAETGDVTRLIPLMMDNETKCEKNWMPFINSNEIKIIGPSLTVNSNKITNSMIKSENNVIGPSCEVENKIDVNPVIKNGNNKIYIIYSVQPLQIYELNEDDGSLIDVKCEDLTPHLCTDFRGSAPPIPYKDGWLCVIHQVHYASPRKYLHRFVFFDKNFNTISYSDPFYFEKIGIEFCMGICHSEEGLILTYSQNDANANLIVIDYSFVDSMLKM